MSGKELQAIEKVYREEGVALLVLRREEEEMPPLPTRRAEMRLHAFAEALWREVLSHAEEKKVPALRAAYRADENPKKRFTTRPQCVRYALAYSLADGVLSLHRTYLVTWRARTLFSLDDTLRFDAKSGFLLPKKKRKTRKNLQRKR